MYKCHHAASLANRALVNKVDDILSYMTVTMIPLHVQLQSLMQSNKLKLPIILIACPTTSRKLATSMMMALFRSNDQTSRDFVGCHYKSRDANLSSELWSLPYLCCIPSSAMTITLEHGNVYIST